MEVNQGGQQGADESAFILRKPCAEDGWSVHQLIAACPPLDTNSSYCNLLQTLHFSDTSIIAVRDQQVGGFISGYIKPAEPETLFIWQVAVAEAGRGQGLASSMLKAILANNPQVRYLETTVTLDNQASWALFTSLARTLNTGLEKSVLFDAEEHFNNQHDSEWLARIGPFDL